MPSIYLPKASMPDYYDISLSFGDFRLALNEQESDDTRYLADGDLCVFQGKTLTHRQVQVVFAERDRRVDEDSERVLAANAARNEQLASRSGNAQRQRENALLAQRQKLTARIAWADGEIARTQNALRLETATLEARRQQIAGKQQIVEAQAQNEIARLTTIKCNAELALLELPA